MTKRKLLKQPRYKKPRMHIVIPDTQCKPRVALNHMLWAGDYVGSKMPDVLVQIGDNHDMPSLSSYDRGTKAAEGRRYKEDIDAGNYGIELFERAMKRAAAKHQQWLAELRKVVTLGNHEQRIERHVNYNPTMAGQIGYQDLSWKKHGWEVVPFLHPIRIDGISYCHYFVAKGTGKPLGGNIHTRLKQIGFSFTMGHQQGKDSAERYLQDGTAQRGLVAGSYYLHDEEYLGPQGNMHWRGIIVKNEVSNGNYDLLEVSLDFLRRRYEEKYPKDDHSPVIYHGDK